MRGQLGSTGTGKGGGAKGRRGEGMTPELNLFSGLGPNPNPWLAERSGGSPGATACPLGRGSDPKPGLL